MILLCTLEHPRHLTHESHIGLGIVGCLAFTLLSPTIGCRILFIWKKLIVLIHNYSLDPASLVLLFIPVFHSLRLFGKNRMVANEK